MNNPIEKCARDMNRQFGEKKTQVANKHIRRHSISLLVLMYYDLKLNKLKP